MTYIYMYINKQYVTLTKYVLHIPTAKMGMCVLEVSGSVDIGMDVGVGGGRNYKRVKR